MVIIPTGYFLVLGDLSLEIIYIEGRKDSLRIGKDILEISKGIMRLYP